MEQKNHNHNGLGNGFVLGRIVGVVVTLLFTTRKGREIFKELTEKGLDKFSDLEEKFQEAKSGFVEELEEEEAYVEPEARPVVAPEPVKKETKETGEAKATSTSKPHPVRKFFKKKS